MVKRILVALIIAVLLTALFSHLNDSYLRGEEQRRAVVAMEAYYSGEMIVPHLLGWVYFNKPPLFNWALAGLFHVFGSFSEWVVRLPGVLSFLLIGLLGYFIFRRYVGKEIALLTSLAFLTSADILFYASVYAGEIDLFYALLVFLQVSLLFIFHEKRKYLWMFLVSYLFTALGVLTKGLPSLAFQAITLLVLLIYYRQWKLLFGWKHGLGILLFAGVVAGYFYLYSMQEDVLVYLVSLFKEASQRSANEYGLGDILLHILLFPLQVFQLIFPWGLLALFMCHRKFFRTLRSNRLVLFSALFVAGNILLYWISPEIRNRYIYMFFPFILLILVYFFRKYQARDQQVYLWLTRLFGLMILLMAVFFIGIPFLKTISGDIKHPFVIACVFTPLMILIFILFIRLKAHRIYVLMLAFVVARLGLNFAVLPHTNQVYRSADYVSQAQRILEITGEEPVYYIGGPVHLSRDLSLAGYRISEVIRKEPPFIPYQLPYYLARDNGYVMKFSTRPIPGAYCLSRAGTAQNIPKKTILLEYKDPHVPMDMVLFRVEE